MSGYVVHYLWIIAILRRFVYFSIVISEDYVCRFQLLGFEVLISTVRRVSSILFFRGRRTSVIQH